MVCFITLHMHGILDIYTGEWVCNTWIQSRHDQFHISSAAGALFKRNPSSTRGLCTTPAVIALCGTHTWRIVKLGRDNEPFQIVNESSFPRWYLLSSILLAQTCKVSRATKDRHCRIHVGFCSQGICLWHHVQDRVIFLIRSYARYGVNDIDLIYREELMLLVGKKASISARVSVV